jgi:CRISPR/Cas system type I-B associated protein Csh2 (Cas7 group RAMP superfamily)
MNRAVDVLIPKAYETLQKVGIAEGDSIKKGFRGQIATFGSVVKNGSLLAAVAFFSAQGSSDVQRERLMMAIWLLLDSENTIALPDEKDEDYKVKYTNESRKLFDHISSSGKTDGKLKENVINAAVALKLAMNLYCLR